MTLLVKRCQNTNADTLSDLERRLAQAEARLAAVLGARQFAFA